MYAIVEYPFCKTKFKIMSYAYRFVCDLLEWTPH